MLDCFFKKSKGPFFPQKEIIRLNLFLKAAIEVNPDALNQADMADNDCKAGTPGSQVYVAWYSYFAQG